VRKEASSSTMKTVSGERSMGRGSWWSIISNQ
jgi:hypothetical protein